MLISFATQAAIASSPAKPLIGINVDIEGPKRNARIYGTYYEAIEKSGGIPILIPPMPESDLRSLLGRLDGVMLIGGDDYPPSYYGQKQHAKDRVMDETRASFDKLLASVAIKDTKLPILGICAGCQIINISQGGDLIQDIPTALTDSKVIHRSKGDEKIARHTVTFMPGSKLSGLYTAREISVPAAHHQSVDKLGAGLIKSATAQDGVTEAIEMSSKPFVIGVQFHPERDYENNKALFDAFISNARAHTHQEN